MLRHSAVSGNSRAMAYEPDGFTDLAPYLIIADPEAVLKYAETVFGAYATRWLYCS